MISAMFDDDYALAKETYHEVVSLSETLISELERIKMMLPKNSKQEQS